MDNPFHELKNLKKLFFILILSVLLLFQVVCSAENPYNSGIVSGIGYYKAECLSDSIPSSLEAGRSYPVNITFRNSGMVSWEWGVEKFGMLYQGLQSSISVDPIFSPIPENIKITSQNEISFPIILTPPEKPGEYELSFSMAIKKGEEKYTPFADGFTKKIQVIPKEGVSSGTLGSIIVSSEPVGAKVLLGSEDKGKTPLTLPDLNPAFYEITISHPEYPSKWVKVSVQPGSVSRITVNLSDIKEPEVKTDKILKYTPIGWFLDNIPLIIISIILLFLAFQVVMMDTKRVPMNHPVRVMTRPFTLFKPSSDGVSRFGRRDSDKRGGSNKGDNSGNESQSSGETQRLKRLSGSGNIARKGKTVRDRSSRNGEDETKGNDKKTEKEEEKIQIPDSEIDERDQESTWGFPHSLRDKYEPLGVEGDDPYARIFKVKRKDNGEIRALKVGHMKDEGSEILQKETSVWRSLRHPHIVRVYRSEFLDNQTYLESEYLNGINYKGVRYTSLSDLPKPIKKQYAVSIIQDIASGLSYAHETGVRHYHIQPGDILLTSGLRAKLSGFARGKNELGFSIPDSDVSEVTAAYITPEQKDEKIFGNSGRRTDIYQLGVIFYELLTGYLPYSAGAYQKSGREGSFEENSEELILPSEIRRDLNSYDNVLIRMLSKKKSERYYYMEDLLRDLEEVKLSEPKE